MDNALYQLREFEMDIQMKNLERKTTNMSINDAAYINDAYQAIVSQGLLEWFKNYDPSNGFMLASTPELTRITSVMKLMDQHSGASYALTMKAVQNIVRNITH